MEIKDLVKRFVKEDEYIELDNEGVNHILTQLNFVKEVEEFTS